MSTVLVVGSINADHYIRIERLPLPGETLAGREPATRPGGKGANQAAAVARLGQQAYFVGQVGDDTHGHLLRTALVDIGVGVEHLKTVPGPSGQALILLQDGGENSIIVIGGANQAWTALPAPVETAISRSSALLIQREIPMAVNLSAARCAQAAGVPVILDAGGGEDPLAPELLATLAVLSPNELELARLTGMPTDSEDQILAAGRQLLVQGVGSVLVKLGSRGSLLLDGDGGMYRQGIFAADVVDTTGAGDCFTAAYAVALVEGRPAPERLRFAAAAAALCVSRLGAMPSLPERAEVEAVLGYDRTGGRSALA